MQVSFVVCTGCTWTFCPQTLNMHTNLSAASVAHVAVSSTMLCCVISSASTRGTMCLLSNCPHDYSQWLLLFFFCFVFSLPAKRWVVVPSCHMRLWLSLMCVYEVVLTCCFYSTGLLTLVFELSAHDQAWGHVRASKWAGEFPLHSCTSYSRCCSE